MYSDWVVLALLLWPVAGALAVLAAPDRWAKHIALAVALVEFAISVPMWWTFVPSAGMQFRFDAPWVPAWGIRFTVGVDGISLFLVLLTTLLVPLSVLGSYATITTRERGYYALLLALTSGMIGVFVALDLFLFFVMWEVMLIPMYFIIGVWGGDGRLYAALKFFVYTMLGSMLMLVAILTLVHLVHQRTGVYSFSYEHLMAGLGDLGTARLLAVRRVLPRVRHQGPGVPVPHLAPRRAHGGAHRGIGDPRRHSPEDGHLRIPAVRLPVLSGGGAAPRHPDGDRRAVAGRHPVRRPGGDGAARFQTADRLLVGGAPGVRDARDLGPHRAERAGSIAHHDQPRHLDRRAVLPGGDDL